tara:strand:- start:146 stop:856 length:711 start_codon:yes stop_codon:yes gene_type:complete
MRKININKKGAGHIEIILSSIIFVSFVFFVLLVLKPTKMFARLSTSHLDITESEILKRISTEFSIVSLKIPEPLEHAPDCFFINTDKIKRGKIIVKNEAGERRDAIKVGREISIRYIGEEFYRIYSSEEFDETSSVSGCFGLSDYILGVPRNYVVVSENEITELSNLYSADYSGLKEGLGLKNDFNILIKDKNDREFKLEIYKPEGIDITARDVPIEILNNNGDLIPGVMNIQAWD